MKDRKRELAESPFDMIQDEPIVIFFNKVRDFCSIRIKELVFFGVITLIFLLSITLYFNWKKNSEEKAFTELGLILQKIESSGEEGKRPDFLSELERVEDNYSYTRSASLASLYKARLLFEDQDRGRALEAYNKALQLLKGEWQSLARYERAYLYLALEDKEKALEDFLYVLSRAPYLEETALFHIMRIEADLGNKEKSESYMRQLLEKYPDSFYKDGLS